MPRLARCLRRRPTRTRNLHHRDRVLLPALQPSSRALLRSQGGAHAGAGCQQCRANQHSPSPRRPCSSRCGAACVYPCRLAQTVAAPAPVAGSRSTSTGHPQPGAAETDWGRAQGRRAPQTVHIRGALQRRAILARRSAGAGMARLAASCSPASSPPRGRRGLVAPLVGHTGCCRAASRRQHGTGAGLASAAPPVPEG